MAEQTDPGEPCQRCKSVGQDRRTLHMACFYAMDELGLPFEREILLDADPATLEVVEPPQGIDLSGGKKIILKAAGVRCSGVLRPQQLFTLRVCKRCRAEWLAAIRQWFHTAPEGEDRDSDGPVGGCGSGIFVRENGAVREITRAEWDRREAERERRDKNG